MASAAPQSVSLPGAIQHLLLEYLQALLGNWLSHCLFPPATTHLALRRPQLFLTQVFGSNSPLVRASALLLWEVSFSS